MDNRTEVVLSDLGRLCTPQEHIAPVREIGKWCATPYETNAYSGTMLVAAMESCVKPRSAICRMSFVKSVLWCVYVPRT